MCVKPKFIFTGCAESNTDMGGKFLNYTRVLKIKLWVSSVRRVYDTGSSWKSSLMDVLNHNQTLRSKQRKLDSLLVNLYFSCGAQRSAGLET